MKPKIVKTPDGWTKEMVDLVWQDFYHKLNDSYGGPYFSASRLTSRTDMGNGIFKETYESVIHKLPRIPGTRWVNSTSDSVCLEWQTPEIRLKTWAAVGCPVEISLIENAYPMTVIPLWSPLSISEE